jgi:parvulin-like peptidyl-prolyl isomerase
MNKVIKLATALIFSATLSGAQTLVTVNGSAITDDDLNSALMNATQGRFFSEVPADKQNQIKEQFLQQLVSTELMYGDAKKTGVLKTKEFKEVFDREKAALEKGIAVQLWQKEQIKKISVTKDELQKFYNENKDEFNIPESLQVSHILVPNENEAQDIIKELKPLSGEALATKFAELAKSKSTGPSAPDGGKLDRYFTKNSQMAPEFKDAAFKLNVGEITTTPVHSQFGYHVILLTDKKAQKQATYKEVESILETRLKREKALEFIKSKIEALSKDAKIVVNKGEQK